MRLLNESGEDPHSGKRARCAVVFPAPTLDSEPLSAGQIYIGERWKPLAKLPAIPDVRPRRTEDRNRTPTLS